MRCSSSIRMLSIVRGVWSSATSASAAAECENECE
jgi:hypothetical protein